MRIKENYKPVTMGLSNYMTHTTVGGGHRAPQAQDEDSKRKREIAHMGHRLYRQPPHSGAPWWSNFSDGYPAREGGHMAGIRFFVSGEIELYDGCGGSPTSCRTRNAMHGATGRSIEIHTWSARPVLYTQDGYKLTRNDYKPLYRYCGPHQIDRDATVHCPTVMVDNEYGIATALLRGEGGMYAYWPCEQSYPMTWSSWLVTVENKEVCKVMAAALRKVCRYANAINAMVSAQNLTSEEHNAVLKDADKIFAAWRSPHQMLNYLSETRDPKAIAQKIMDTYTSRQILALAQMCQSWQQSQGYMAKSRATSAALSGIGGCVKFSTTSPLFQMLREQTSNQYETKFLYTKPPAERSSWQLIQPMGEKW